MGNLAGVVENYPLMRDEKLATSHGREELSVRFAKLPPLIETSLVGRKSSTPEKVVHKKKEKERIIAESGVPQVKYFHCITTIGCNVATNSCCVTIIGCPQSVFFKLNTTKYYILLSFIHSLCVDYWFTC